MNVTPLISAPMMVRRARPNTSTSVEFVVKGAEKRRRMAYSRAQLLQREMGVQTQPTMRVVKP